MIIIRARRSKHRPEPKSLLVAVHDDISFDVTMIYVEGADKQECFQKVVNWIERYRPGLLNVGSMEKGDFFTTEAGNKVCKNFINVLAVDPSDVLLAEYDPKLRVAS